MNRKISELEEVIGYHFNQKQLLKHAMTHSSYANEKRWEKTRNNERLEFLGDAVLELVTSDFLYQKHLKMPEGELTKKRAGLVCEPSLAYCAEEICLGEYLLLGKGEEATGGRFRPSVTSDAMEALIGAIYLDGGFANAKEFIHRFILNDIEHKQLFYDSKTILQEVVQGQNMGAMEYGLIAESGPDHAKLFTVELSIGGKPVSTGSGQKKKAAEQEAAYLALVQMQET